MLKLFIFLSLMCFSQNVSHAHEKLRFPPTLVGDNNHVEVYTFLIQALKETPSFSEAMLQEKRQSERTHHALRSWKSHYANIAEGEIASLLKILCKNHPTCQEITVYQKNGLGIATSSLKAPLYFQNRPQDFSMGILSPHSMKKLGITRYKTEDNREYHDYVFAIYLTSRRNGYVDLLQRHAHDKLIGYVSCLLEIKSL